jgi:hypothetical protein
MNQFFSGNKNKKSYGSQVIELLTYILQGILGGIP